MRKITNEKLITRNQKIGNWATIAGLVLLFASVVIGFRYANLLSIALILTLAGFIVSQIGMFMINRYGGNPRVDEILNKALKGLPNSTTIYHFIAPVSHMVVSPGGVWIINLRNIRGQISYDENRQRYRHRGGGFLTGYLKIFGQGGLGRPNLEMKGDIGMLEDFFKKNLPEELLPAVDSVLVFSDDEVELDVENPLHPTTHLKGLKKFLREENKTKRLSEEQMAAIKALFQEATEEEDEVEA